MRTAIHIGQFQRPNNMEYAIHKGEGFKEPTSQDVSASFAFPRPTADQIAALPSHVQERGINPYSRAILGTRCPRFGSSFTSEEVQEALETYQRAVRIFEDARLCFLVALYKEEQS